MNKVILEKIKTSVIEQVVFGDDVRNVRKNTTLREQVTISGIEILHSGFIVFQVYNDTIPNDVKYMVDFEVENTTIDKEPKNIPPQLN